MFGHFGRSVGFFGLRRLGFFAAGFVLGGIVASAASDNASGRKVAVGLVNKGLKLKDSVTYSLSSMKDNVIDIVAEAKAMDEVCADTAETKDVEVCAVVPEESNC